MTKANFTGIHHIPQSVNSLSPVEKGPRSRSCFWALSRTVRIVILNEDNEGNIEWDKFQVSGGRGLIVLAWIKIHNLALHYLYDALPRN